MFACVFETQATKAVFPRECKCFIANPIERAHIKSSRIPNPSNVEFVATNAASNTRPEDRHPQRPFRIRKAVVNLIESGKRDGNGLMNVGHMG